MTKEFVPETTYFIEREERLTREIADAQRDLSAAQEKFTAIFVDLTKRRDAILAVTASLREMQADLKKRTEAVRDALIATGALAGQCEILSDDLLSFLAEPMETVARIDLEIASLEEQKRKKTAKPAHTVEQLEARLSRLRLRKVLAEKAVAPVERGELIDVGPDSVHG